MSAIFFIVIASFAEGNSPSFQYLQETKFETRATCEDTLSKILHKIKASYSASYIGNKDQGHRVFEVEMIAQNDKIYRNARLNCVEVITRN